MKNKKLFTKLFSGLLIGGLLLGGGSMVMAAGANNGAASQAGTATEMRGLRMDGMHRGGPEAMQTMVDELLANGTISQAQADAITAKETELDAARQAQMETMKTERQAQMETMKAMTQAERQAQMETLRAEREASRLANQGERSDLFTELVNDGVFTAAEVDSIKEAMHNSINEQRQAALTSELKTLVDNNTITSDQSTAIQGVMTQFAADRQAAMEATKDMTPEERTAYRQENQKERVNPLATLVAEGTITQAQADTVFHTGAHPQGPRGSIGIEKNGSGNNGNRALKGSQGQGHRGR